MSALWAACHVYVLMTVVWQCACLCVSFVEAVAWMNRYVSLSDITADIWIQYRCARMPQLSACIVADSIRSDIHTHAVAHSLTHSLNHDSCHGTVMHSARTTISVARPPLPCTAAVAMECSLAHVHTHTQFTVMMPCLISSMINWIKALSYIFLQG